VHDDVNQRKARDHYLITLLLLLRAKFIGQPRKGWAICVSSLVVYSPFVPNYICSNLNKGRVHVFIYP